MKQLFLSIIFSAGLYVCAAGQNYLPSSQGEIVEHSYYTLSYSEEHEQAEWVYYQITPQSLSGTATRRNNFREDKAVSTGSAALSDYSGSGYDRGHLCPAGSMTIDNTAMSESFLLSNMSPQVPSFNRGIWKKLEEVVRTHAATDSLIHVVTGPILSNGLETIGANEVSIPEYFYKVIYSPKLRAMIAFLIPNEKSSAPIVDYALSVDEIESITGIDFFYEWEPLLSDLEAVIEFDVWSF